MAKKDKKGEGAVQNREIFQRMNFLYQAALYMATITTPHPATTTPRATTEYATDSSCRSNSNDKDIRALETSSTADTEKTDSCAALVVPQPLQNSSNADAEMENNTKPNKPTSKTSSKQRRTKMLTRRENRALMRERKNNIASDQISNNVVHHSLTKHNKNNDLRQLSGTARFYASTLREIGRKNVIRIDPVIKRSICLRCEAVLVPSVSSEVRIEGLPQLHTLVTCTACGAFRRYFCMPGKGIVGDRWDPEEQVTTTSDVETPGS